MTAVNECMVYVIMALGLNVVVGYAGLLDLGYVAFWAIGVLHRRAGSMLRPVRTGHVQARHPHAAARRRHRAAPGIHVNFWLVLLSAAIACAIAGILIGAPTLRLRGDYLAIVTLGFGEIIRQFFRNGNEIAGMNLTNGDPRHHPDRPDRHRPLREHPGRARS